MIRDYFKIAWRNLIKRKFYTILNISGLALGISCCMLIYLYTSYQLSFDLYHKNTDHLFRLVNELHLDKTEYEPGSSIGMFRGLKSEFSQIEKGAVSIARQSFVVDVNGDPQKRFREEKNISFTDAGWFKLFRYNFIKGNPAQLDQLNTAILTQKIAEKYFGNTDPIGQTITIGKEQIKVVGVISNPTNTDLKADMYLSISSFLELNPSLGKDYLTNWGYTMTTHNAFFYLKDVNQQHIIEKQLPGLVEKHMGKGSSQWFRFKLLPFEQMHFDTRFGGSAEKSLLTILALIGVLILTIAGINYVNLIIAQQARRSIEIGTRKVLGGSSGQLFMQFMIESLLTSVIAVAISLCIVIAILPSLNTTLFAVEPVQILSYRNLYLFAGIVLILVTIGAGIYPAYIMSKINVFKALKNTSTNWLAGLSRKTLVVVQNVVAQVLIICTIIIVMQVRFLKNTDKGFDRESVVMIPFEKASQSQREVLSQQLKSMPGVKSFSFCFQPPASVGNRGATIKLDERADWEHGVARFSFGDSAYCKTFGLHLIAGRVMRANTALPEYIVNEKLASQLYPKNKKEVIGKILSAGDQKGTIVGIVRDFNTKSLLIPIEPTLIMDDDFLRTSLAVKLSGRQTAATIDQLKQIYQQAFPDQLFSYQFLDDQIAQLYAKESLQEKFIWIASCISILVSSLGLLGLISLMTLQRTKEIGIRKVLGASVAQIVSLLSGSFIKMILLAFIIASPIAWVVMSKWLQNFAYRIDVQWWIFALGGMMAILVALLTVSIQAVRAAIANPVKSLRAE